MTFSRGGTNLRVGFIELLGPDPFVNGVLSENGGEVRSRVQRQLEQSWPIGELLKQNKAEDLFKWIGECIAEVVQEGCRTWPGLLPDPLPLGVTFSFPMVFVTFPHFSTIRLTMTANITYQMPRSWVWAKDSPFNLILTWPRFS